MQTATLKYRIHPIRPDTVAVLLACDDAGRAPRVVIDEVGGSPLRCCLAPTQPGEDVALLSYAPLRRWASAQGIDPGAYDEVGPIFLHRGGCEGVPVGGYPSWLRTAPRVFRAYSSEGTILSGTLVDAGGAFDEKLETLFGDRGVALVHARALAFGCFTFEVRRD